MIAKLERTQGNPQQHGVAELRELIVSDNWCTVYASGDGYKSSNLNTTNNFQTKSYYG